MKPHLYALIGVILTTAAFYLPVAVSQTESAAVSGRVTDESGALVLGAEVTLQSIDRGSIQQATSNADGIYAFTSVEPGRYHMTIHKAGFKGLDLVDLVVNVQDHIEKNFKLQVGSVAESITVNGALPVMNTADASVSTVIDRQFVEALPLNGRSFNTLLQLTPGVVIAPVTSTGGGQFNIAGQRATANEFSVDGVSANFGVAGSLGVGQSGVGTTQAFSALGGTSSLVSVDALQEFRIDTSSFAPDSGNSPGGQVILTTRSGTNNFHGGVFDYFRNTVMDANDWFANQVGNPRAPEHHNDFGGFLGGPIWKNRSFFFFSYEGARLDLPQTSVIQVPSQQIRDSASTPPAVASILNAYPVPNGPLSPGGDTQQFTGTFSNRATLNAVSLRIDHTFSEKYSAFARYNYAPTQTVSRPDVYSLSDVETADVNTQTFTAGLNMLPSSRTSNIIRGNYSSQFSSTADRPDTFGGAVPFDPSDLVGSFPSANTQLIFTTFDTTNIFSGPQAKNRSQQLNFVDDFAIGIGTHQLKFGTAYRAIFLRLGHPPNSLVFSQSSVEQFVSTQTVNLSAFTSSSPDLWSQVFSLYAQDTWKVTPKLTLTYGVHWQLSPAPAARGNTVLAAWKNVDDPANISLAPPGTPLWSTTYNNFAPRIGLAYSLTGKRDLVLRAGWGIFYDLGVASAAEAGSYFPTTASAPEVQLTVPGSNISPFLPALSLRPPYSTVWAFSPDLRLPRSYQWNLALEKSFGGQTISATYVGQAGRDLLRQSALSAPNVNFAGGDFILTENDARSNYNALQLQYRRPLVKRLQALLNYSWSHSLDSSSNDAVAGLSNTVISAAHDYASSDFDVRNSFSGAVTFATPGTFKNHLLSFPLRDWSLSGILVARGGFPFNAQVLSTSPDLLGIASSRPDIVPGQPFLIAGSQCASVFQGLGVLAPGQSCPGGEALNPSAFSVPSTIRQGTEGRNNIRGFGLTQLDLSLDREFPITERVRVGFRADAFNVLNHPNFANPQAVLDVGPANLLSTQMLNQGLGGLNPLFQQGGPRSLQLALKLKF